MSRFHDLLQHLAAGVETEYQTAQQSARERDPQRAGHQGESTWVRLLEQWGPGLPVVTRRYIVGSGGESNEVDVVLLRPDYPKQLRDEPSVLVSGVAAAFSCKLTLRSGHIREAIEQKRLLNEVAGHPKSSAQVCLSGMFPFGLLAHSSSIAPKSEDPVDALQNAYEALAHRPGEGLVTEPADELDALLVADRGFLSTTRASLAPRRSADGGDLEWLPQSSFDRHPATVKHPGTPLAQLMFWLGARCGGTSLAAFGSMFGADSARGFATSWPMDPTYPQHIRDAWRQTLLNNYGNPLLF